MTEPISLPLERARAWLEVASSVPEEPSYLGDLFDFAESSTLLLRSSVDVLRMKRTGELCRRIPNLKPRAPKDANTRLRHLCELLSNEPELTLGTYSHFLPTMGDQAANAMESALG